MFAIFKFNSLLTPSIIKFLFYIGIIFWIITGLAIIIAGNQLPGFMSIFTIIGGCFVMLIGIIFSRIFTETILVFFMIRDELAWQREQRQQAAVE